MTFQKVNLASLINKNVIRTKEKDEYILSKTNISKEDLESSSDDKYKKILEIIKAEEAKKVETENVETNAVETEKSEDENVETNAVETEKSEDIEEEFDENAEMFSNYKSEFKDKETKILTGLRTKRLKIRAKLRMPKTRTWFVMALISLTVISISSLFLLFPEKHSLSVYKASIQNIKVKYIEKPWIAETINIEDFSFRVISQEQSDWKIYKYNWITYSSKSELNIVLNKEVATEKYKLEKINAENLEKSKFEIIKTVLINKFKD